MDNWLTNLVVKAMRIYREAAGNHRQDATGPVLENLKDQGYTQVTWNSNGSHHAPCRDLNRQVWDLQDFLNTTEYDAPLFSRSHPGDANCTLIVSGDNVPNVEVDSYGDVDHNIRTPFPVKKPVPVLPKQKVLTPKPKVQVVEKPIAPKEPKVRYIPKEVHKQIDPFEKQLSEEERLKQLEELEKKEPGYSSIINPELTDEELEEMQEFNKETSKKIPNWIRGIFK